MRPSNAWARARSLPAIAPKMGALLMGTVASVLPAQVVISEIKFPNATDTSQWIEITNLGGADVDLSSWSVYQASKSPGRAQNYWFGFPNGTTVTGTAGNAPYIRIHWLAPIQGEDRCNIKTGTSNLNFLFGLGAENLSPSLGAVGLFSSQNNADMNNPAVVQDWVSWGESGFKREDLAVQNGRWVQNTFTPAFTGSAAGSIAFIYQLQEPTPASAFFRDNTPTPPTLANGCNGHNFPGALSNAFGAGCAPSGFAIPSLQMVGLPAGGNQDLVIQASPVPTNFVTLLIIGNRKMSTQITPSCTFEVFWTGEPVVFIPGNVGGTAVQPFTINDQSLSGFPFYTQLIGVDFVLGLLFTNALEFVLGG